MRDWKLGILVAALASAPSTAFAQDREPAFSGSYAGAAAGAVDHHFVLEETVTSGGVSTTRQFNVTQWGVGGELFGGYDLALAKRLVVSGEAQFEFGGAAAVERNSFYTYGIKPRYGLSATARLGYIATPRLLVYGGGGYGVHQYRTVVGGTAVGTPGLNLGATHSFVLRGGLELAASRRTHVRLEFEHLDGSRNQFMLGLPIRF